MTAVQTYLDHLTTVGVDTTFVLDERGGLTQAISDQSQQELEERLAASTSLELGRTLGEGGMGIVRLGRQQPLDRDVAVKTVRAERDTPGSRAAVLREAWVTGHLQHPNVVPVYSVDTDDDGRPVIVMKRVDGVSWAVLIREPERHPGSDPTSDPLELHLDILDRVCLAVHYAHSRGVCHRDIKPENVMVGAFGEVTVLDWGMAASLPGHDLPLPSCSTIRGVEGTPGYLAPEMAAVDTERIGVGSDVYLLGATLHEVLTGEVLHQGDSLPAILASAFAATHRDYPGHPAELAGLVRRATERDPADRFPDVESFRRAIQAFRQHRASNSLSAEAGMRADELRELLDQARHGDEVESGALSSLATEARFGYQLALRSWPENPDARAGHHQVLGDLFDFYLESGARTPAAEILEAAGAPQAWKDRLHTLDDELARRAEEQERLEQLQRDVFKGRGAGAKSRAALAIGLAMGLVALGMHLLETRHEIGYVGYFALVFVFFAVSMGDAVRTWHRKHNRSSREQLKVIALGQLSLALNGGLCLVFGVPISTTLALGNGLASLMSGVFAQLFFVRMTWASATWMLAPALIAVWPEWMWIWTGVSAMAGMGALALVWRGEAARARKAREAL